MNEYTTKPVDPREIGTGDSISYVSPQRAEIIDKKNQAQPAGDLLVSTNRRREPIKLRKIPREIALERLRRSRESRKKQIEPVPVYDSDSKEAQTDEVKDQ